MEVDLGNRVGHDRTEKGQSLVELAFGMVVLLVLLAGIVDLGRLLFFYIAMRDAAQEGAVYGQLNPMFCLDIHNRVNDYLGVTPGQSGYTILVEEKKNPGDAYVPCGVSGPPWTDTPPSTNIACAGSIIKVTVTAPFTFVMPFMSGNIVSISTDIEGNILRPACIN